MKKGFISAIFVALLIAIPTLAQAEEKEQSQLPVDLKTTQKTKLDVEGVDQSKDAGLLKLGVELPIVGDVQVDLLSEKQSKSGTTQSSQGKLVGLEVKNSELLGDVKVEVLNNNKKDENGTSSSTSSLVAVDVDNALLGKTHVGVIEGNKKGSSSEANSSASLLVLDTNSKLLGNNRVGVVEYTNNNGQQSINPVKVSDRNVIEPNTGELTIISKNPVERNDMFINQLEAKSGSAVGDLIVDKEVSIPSLPTKLALALNTDYPVSKNPEEIAKEVYEKLVEINDISDVVMTSSSIITSNSGSSTASSGAIANSGGTGLAGYLAVDDYHEVETSYAFTDVSKKLATQWDKIPPRDPPKEAFFLIA